MGKKSAQTLGATAPVAIQNSGLGEAVGYPGSLFGFPQNQGTGWTEQVSNVTTVFRNLRWYLVSNMRQVLNQAYVELGLVQTIVDVPVDDALRGGVTVKTKQLDPEEIEQLKAHVGRAEDVPTAGWASKWTRLFGGGGIVILSDQDPSTPLNIEALGDDLGFRAVDMWELTWTLQNTEVYDPTVQDPEFEFYDYYGIKLHRSRVLRMEGKRPPSFIRPRLRGWGFSVVEALVRSLNQYLKGTDLAFEVMDEFKVDFYKIKNLTNTLMTDSGTAAVRRRLQIANYQKNYQNAMVMDSEDDWDHKQLSFAGLAEAMQGVRLQVASDMRMPLTKLFGLSAQGFNSGEDDLEVYNSMVESDVREKVKGPILRMVELRCQELFGFIPDDLSIEFQPLRVLSTEQMENVKTQKFNRVMQARQAGEISSLEFRDACNRDELLGIQLETDRPDVEDELGVDDEPTDEETDDDAPAAKAGKSKRDAKPSRPAKEAKVENWKPLNWDEDDHPRDDDGKFAAGGGGGSGGGDSKKSKSKQTSVSSGPLGTPAPDEIRLVIELRKVKESFYADAHVGKDADISQLKAPEGYEVVEAKKTVTGKSFDGYRVKFKKAEKSESSGGKAKKENAVTPFSTFERLMRRTNSAAFDRASYMADGGHDWIDPRRKHFFEEPAFVDAPTLEKAKRASVAALGEERWEFVVWWLRKQGVKVAV